VCVSAEPRLQRRVNLGGEGDALYPPVFSNFSFVSVLFHVQYNTIIFNVAKQTCTQSTKTKKYTKKQVS